MLNRGVAILLLCDFAKGMLVHVKQAADALCGATHGQPIDDNFYLNCESRVFCTCTRFFFIVDDVESKRPRVPYRPRDDFLLNDFDVCLLYDLDR